VAEYRVDELARQAGTTVRNVRVYQDRQLLPVPIKRGRTAIYTDAHLSRLRLVINMLGRGYAFAQIKEMLAAWESGYSLAELLGLEESLGASWTDEQPEHITLTRLREMFGGELSQANVRRALELELLERRGARFYAPSPQLVEAGRQLVELGVPLAEALELAAQLQQDVDHVAGLMVAMVRRYVLDPKGPGWLPSGDELPYYVDVLSKLKPLVNSALSAAVARSANRVIPDIIGDRLAAVLEQNAAPEAR
jgi:DNA-binding transcriptional MerR regulator